MSDLQQQWIATFIAASNHQLETTTHLRALWFRNPLNHESLRLTHQGVWWVKKNTAMTIHSTVIPDILSSKQILQMERAFKAPYFLSGRMVWLFSEVDFVMLTLHDGNLAQYLDNLQI